VFVANSSAVRDRIGRFFGRDAVVVHPPVDVDDFEPSAAKDPGQFLWVGRLIRYKRPDLVVGAFRGLPYRLVIVGVGPLEKELRRYLPDNVVSSAGPRAGTSCRCTRSHRVLSMSVRRISVCRW